MMNAKTLIAGIRQAPISLDQTRHLEQVRKDSQARNEALKQQMILSNLALKYRYFQNQKNNQHKQDS